MVCPHYSGNMHGLMAAVFPPWPQTWSQSCQWASRSRERWPGCFKMLPGYRILLLRKQKQRTVPILIQFLHIRQLVQGIHLTSLTPNRLVWRWCASGQYYSRLAYRMMFRAKPPRSSVRRSCGRQGRQRNRCRFFVWLVLHGRLWTSDRLQRHAWVGACNALKRSIIFWWVVYSHEVWFN
jgi:hypothetical protein